MDGPLGRAGGVRPSGPGQGSSRLVRRPGARGPGAGGWELRAGGPGLGVQQSLPSLFFPPSSSLPEQLAPLRAVNHWERAFAEGQPSLLSTKPAETREGGGQALPLSACAADRPAHSRPRQEPSKDACFDRQGSGRGWKPETMRRRERKSDKWAWEEGAHSPSRPSAGGRAFRMMRGRRKAARRSTHISRPYRGLPSSRPVRR